MPIFPQLSKLTAVFQRFHSPFQKKKREKPSIVAHKLNLQVSNEPPSVMQTVLSPLPFRGIQWGRATDIVAAYFIITYNTERCNHLILSTGPGAILLPFPQSPRVFRTDILPLSGLLSLSPIIIAHVGNPYRID